MGVVYATETLSPELIADASELIQMHREEIAIHEDFDLDPDWESYFTGAMTGVFVVCTARDEGKLVGYAAYAIYQNLHFRGLREARQDVLFLHPDYRGRMLGLKLLQFAEEFMKSINVKLITQHVNVDHDFGPMLERLGYVNTEKIYEKRLDK